MKKVLILIGNYCSGKTEIALNLAVRAAGEGKRTQVIDLDRINDYFRMSDHVNYHAGAAPAQIGKKTDAAKLSVFLYNSDERGKLQSTVGGVVRNSSVAKAVCESV